MKITGVILAAGKAERMPNKCLLPLDPSDPSRGVVMDSAREFLGAVLRPGGPADADNEYREMIVVPPSGSMWEYVRQRPEYAGYTKVRQPSGAGVVDAITRAAIAACEGSLVVTFADNVYPPGDVCKNFATSFAVTRVFDLAKDPWARSLDAFEKDWLDRLDNNATNCRKRLAGWLVLSVDQLLSLDRVPPTLPELLRAIKAGSVEFHQDGWYDCGTKEAYTQYLQSGWWMKRRTDMKKDLVTR